MEIDLYENGKVAAVWLSNAEKEDPGLRKNLKQLYGDYKRQGILAVEYRSGQGEVRQDLLSLLRYNRKRWAEKELSEEQTGGPSS